MLFQHVAIAGLAHIDAPRRLTSDEIHARLRPTLDRLGIKSNILQDVAGVSERRLWDGEMKASDAATLAGVKALADAGIDADRIGLLVNTSVSRDYLEPSTASIVAGNLRLGDECQNFDVANACLAFLKAFSIDPTKVMTIFGEHGNIGPASVPIVLSKLREMGTLKKGNRIALLGIGSGLNCSMAEVVW